MNPEFELQPDITSPGSEIIAAYSPSVPPSIADTRHLKYSILSGTLMSCPHVAGVAAYIKTFHPRWSPSMIQSAIMTTGKYTTFHSFFENTLSVCLGTIPSLCPKKYLEYFVLWFLTAWPVNASTLMPEFAYGAGHVNPLAAVHPGLVYEANKSDYIAFLCGLKYTGKNLRLISGESRACTKAQSKSLPRNLNYPSMTAQVPATKPFKVTFRRTVTNVGTSNTTYKAKVVGSKLNVEVIPDVFSLKSMHEKKSFTVTVSGKGLGAGELVASSQLIWSDGFHFVRSPIVVYAPNW